MAVDYISTLNKNGSGLNLSELAGSIAAAETAPKIYAAEKKKAEAEVAISAYAQLRAAFEDFDGSLAYMQGASVLSATSGSSAISVEVTERSAVTEATSSVDVIQTAQRQVLEFTGFTGPDDVIGTGDISVEFGVWTEDSTTFTANPSYPGSTITIGEGATLQDFADALSSLDGVTAKVLDRGDGTYTLGIVSEEGAGRAMRFQTTNATGALVDFDTTTTNVDKQVQAAQNALLTVDGVTIFRDTNVIDDAIDGLTLTLNGTTEFPTGVTVKRDAELASQMLQTFVSQINTTIRTIKDMTVYGTAENDAGDLAGDRTAQKLLKDFTDVLKQPLTGHRDDPVYMADLGVATNRDGTLYLNTALFERAFTNDPDAFDQVFQDTFRADNEGITVSGTANSSTKSGSYDFSFDPNAGTVRMGNSSMFATALDDNMIRFVATSGDMAGVVMLMENTATTGTISYGRSLVSSLREVLDDALRVNGTFDSRDTHFNNIMTEQDAELKEAEERTDTIETRYLKRFAAMETAISALNATGEYLSNLVDSWNKS
ncbi:flagellar filament capping protein FliD [Marivivens donghaensis]|uniref:Flagellar hook-associated protein 2 n=1 Tax=Marivivens donghaensis TaxID=1699413 RepID=A0ABX0VVK4_9RHOB|nr:flagellar filament capping protein FliD [Marivivens donghaensis]NIY70869.1 flagellar filament capping protein FliD [Marivivens donghaensis]